MQPPKILIRTILAAMAGIAVATTAAAPALADAASYRVAAARTTVANSVVTAAGTIAGRFTDTAGGPAANLSIVASSVDETRAFSAVTAADGSYSMKVQPNVPYLVSFSNGLFAQYVPHTFDAGQATKFVVRRGRTIQVGDQAIQLATASGRLVDAAGAPIEYAGVEFIGVDSTITIETDTDADGRYRLDQMPPGQFKVKFTVDGHDQYAYQKLDVDSADVITLAPGGVATVDDQLLPVAAGS